MFPQGHEGKLFLISVDVQASKKGLNWSGDIGV